MTDATWSAEGRVLALETLKKGGKALRTGAVARLRHLAAATLHTRSKSRRFARSASSWRVRFAGGRRAGQATGKLVIPPARSKPASRQARSGGLHQRHDAAAAKDLIVLTSSASGHALGPFATPDATPQFTAPFTPGSRVRYTTGNTMPTSDLARILIAIGVVALVAGIVLLLWPRLPLLGRLPGDLSFHKGNFQVFVPIATSLVLSLVLTVVINVVLRLFK